MRTAPTAGAGVAGCPASAFAEHDTPFGLNRQSQCNSVVTRCLALRGLSPSRRCEMSSPFQGKKLRITALLHDFRISQHRRACLMVRLIAGAVVAIALIAAQKLGHRLGQQLVIDNRSGASGAIGAEALVHAAPDGYTIGIATLST